MIDSLRKSFAQTGKGRRWIDLLPLALWCANDLPGPISGISPHRLLFGRDPIGFGEHPPTNPEVGCEDALQFFNRVRSEREFVSDKLSRLHERRTKESLAEHPPPEI